MKWMLVVVALGMGAAWGIAAGSDRDDLHSRLVADIVDPQLRAMTLQVLRGLDTDYVRVANANLAKQGQSFAFARIEVTGVNSSDDTFVFNPRDFDAQIKPSASAKSSGILEYIRQKIPFHRDNSFGFDVREFREAASGNTTAAARDTLAAYKDKEVGEIVAHSWGAELVYAAILNHAMLPPRRLIIVGVPDNDVAKWRMLAARTGTEVHWVRSPNDRVAAVGALVAKRAAAGVDFNARWDEFCRSTPDGCPAHGRQPKALIGETVGQNPGTLGHDREAYYDLLRKRGLLSDSILDLRRAETAARSGELRRVMALALWDAIRNATSLLAVRDEGLKQTYAKLAMRSCLTPGSVSQAELDALDNPRASFADSSYPEHMGLCGMTVYFSLGRGVSAETIQTLSTPKPAAVLNVTTPSSPAQAQTPFNSMFDAMSAFAQTACRSDQHGALPKALYQPSMPFYFSPGLDSRIENTVSSSLGTCAQSVFQDVVAMVRDGRGSQLDAAWVDQKVAPFRVAQVVGPVVLDRNESPDGPAPPPEKKRECHMEANAAGGPDIQVCTMD